MLRFVVTVIWIACLEEAFSSKETSPRELHKKLFSDYNPKVLPITQRGDRVQLKLGLSPIYIRELDEERGILSLDSWVIMKWNDSQLEWDASAYGGIDHLIVPSNDVWKPDISVYNTSPSKKLHPLVHTNTIVNHTGAVFWVPPFTINSRCDLEYSDYPADVQHCDIKLGSWTYGSLSFDVQSEHSRVNLDDFDNSNPEWSLEDASVEKTDKYYDCCPNEFYTTLDYKLTLKRKRSGEALIADAVSLFAVFLGLLMFWLPPGSTHKVILGALAEILLGLEALSIGASAQSIGARIKCNERVYPFMCLVGVMLILEIITINVAGMSGPYQAPQWLLAAAKGFCQPFRFCISRLNSSALRKEDEESTKGSSEDEGQWKLVAMALDRAVFFTALIIFVLFYTLL